MMILFNFQNRQKKQAVEIVTNYFELLNEQKIEEAEAQIYLKPEFSSIHEAAILKYKAFPPDITLQITMVEQINPNLVQVDVTTFDNVSKQEEYLNMFVMNPKVTEMPVLIPNPYNIPDEYMENVVIPYNPDVIFPSEIVGSE